MLQRYTRDHQTEASLEEILADRIAERVAEKVLEKIRDEFQREEQKYLTVTEAAKLARKSRKTIYEAIYSGHLDFIQDGKRYHIEPAALDDWMKRGAPR